MPRTWLVGSILTSIFGFLPLGVLAVIYSTRVKSKYFAGDYAGSVNASKKAKLLVIINCVLFLLTVIGMIVLVWAAGSGRI